MNNQTWQILDDNFTKFPILKAESIPITEIEFANKEVGIDFPQDYIDFISKYGGAIVGPYPILGLRQAEEMGNDCWSVVEMNKRYRVDQWLGVDDWLIVSVDQAGNPIGIAPDGKVWISDHDFQIIEPIAENFEEFLLALLQGKPL